MEGLSTGPFMGFGYDPPPSQDPYPGVSRPAWSEHYQSDQIDSRTPQQHHHGANNDGAKRSTTPLPSSDPVYQHAIRPQHALSLPFQSSGHQDFFPQPVSAIQDFRPSQKQDQCQSYDASVFHPDHLTDHLTDQTATYASPMTPQQQQQQDESRGFSAHPHPDLGGNQTTEWPMSAQSQSQPPYTLNAEIASNFHPMPHFSGIAYQTSPTEYLPSADQTYSSAFSSAYLPPHLSSHLDNMPFEWEAFPQDLSTFPALAAPTHGLTNLHHATALPNSPMGSSPTSSDHSWQIIETSIIDPRDTLHVRSESGSSSDSEPKLNRSSLGSFVDVNSLAVGSPSSDGAGDLYLSASHSSVQHPSPVIKQESQTSSPVLSRTTVKPIQIQNAPSPQRSPINKSPSSCGAICGRNSPPGKRQPRKNSAKAAKGAIHKNTALVKSETEKKVGRRKGPLRPEQRKQACEIRKRGACLRCRYLKKTCDIGDPCDGCQPHHTRLWNIPCVRTDIRDLGGFLKDWKQHFEQNISLGFSITNIKGHGPTERLLWITHGYGDYLLPVRAREVLVREEGCFGLEWVEQVEGGTLEMTVETARLATGVEGIQAKALSAYLDKHIDSGFQEFVDSYFEGTKFVTEMLKTAHNFYLREESSIVRKALKMLLAYSLTHHITLVECIPDEEDFEGRIYDQDSKFYQKIAAPVMINFEVKCAMAAMWRDLQKEVLEDLSPLYASIYSREKFRNWPTIFMVLTILLCVWEEIQFDYHYRIPDREVVQNFCHEMESIPIRVLVGLFSTVSQRLPSVYEWNTAEHHQSLNSNPAVCDTMTAVRQHVETHDEYLRTRCDASFSRDDFDSLSSKFMSQLVLRPST